MNEACEVVIAPAVQIVLVYQMEQTGQVTVDVYQIITQVMTVMTVLALQMVMQN